MHTYETKNNHITIIFILSLFFLFAFSSIVLLLLGSEVYQETASSLQSHYEERSIASYLTEKIRQNDSKGQIGISYMENTQVLGLSQTISGISYTTYLYVYDDYLYELFTRSDLAFALGDGQKIFPLSSLQFSFQNTTLLKITYTDISKASQTIWVSTHTTQEYDT